MRLLIRSDYMKDRQMLPKFVAVALAIDLIATCVAGAPGPFSRLLPIGHSNVAQLGILLGIAVSASHLVNAFNDKSKRKDEE